MNSEELTAAVESLQKLEHHYKSQYEDYLAKALAAKANLDRLEILLKDLSSQFALYPEEQESFLEFEPEEESTNGNSPQLELDWMRASIEDDDKPSTEPETNDDLTQEISHREFVQLSSQVMPILKSIFALDVGKKLHLSYLSKAVNQKSLLGLTPETIELFLDEAIALGYCERDIYDKNCYYSVPDDKALIEEAYGDNPYKRTFDGEGKQQQNQEKSVTLTKPTHRLPPNSRVKLTVFDTIVGYLTECQPKTFTARDVVNYLYSEAEQKHWSKERKDKVIQAIAGSLSNSKNKKWKRIRIGVYKPLLPLEETVVKPTHNLPPSPRVKMNMLDTIKGYIDSCQPKTFGSRDVLNYLYSDSEQKQWTENQKDNNVTAINSALYYYFKQKKWKRVKMGVYSPI